MTFEGDWPNETDDQDDLDFLNLPPYQIHCDECGYLLVDSEKPVSFRGDYTTTCPTGECIEYRCARCHKVWGGAGPVMCSSCGSLTRWGKFCFWLEDQYDKLRNKITRRKKD